MAAIVGLWVEPIRAKLDEWQREESHEAVTAKRAVDADLAEVTRKLERLLDAQLEGMLEREEYLARKERLLAEKARLREQLGNLGSNGNVWLKPLREFVTASINAASVARQADEAEIAGFLKSAGSNLTLEARRARGEWVPPYSLVGKFRRSSNWWVV